MLPKITTGQKFQHRTVTPGEAEGAQRPDVFTFVGIQPETGEILLVQDGGNGEEPPARWDPVTFHETFGPL